MVWKRAKTDDITDIRNFLLHHELNAASLSSRLISDSGRSHGRTVSITLPEPYVAELLLLRSEHEVLGVVYVEQSGFSFPLFSSAYKKLPEQLRSKADEPLAAWLERNNRKLFSVMGSSWDSRHFIALCGRSPYHSVHYRSMSRGPESMGSKMDYSNDYNVRCADSRDIKSLLPLQIAYETEEVVIPGKQVNPRFAMQQLKLAVDSGQVLILERQGEIIAKAQTNAIGMCVAQIGGVYTRQDERNQGLGRLLVESLSRKIIEEGRLASLFVKKHNKAAIRVYKNCGFEETGDFDISYF